MALVGDRLTTGGREGDWGAHSQRVGARARAHTPPISHHNRASCGRDVRAIARTLHTPPPNTTHSTRAHTNHLHAHTHTHLVLSKKYVAVGGVDRDVVGRVGSGSSGRAAVAGRALHARPDDGADGSRRVDLPDAVALFCVVCVRVARVLVQARARACVTEVLLYCSSVARPQCTSPSMRVVALIGGVGRTGVCLRTPTRCRAPTTPETHKKKHKSPPLSLSHIQDHAPGSRQHTPRPVPPPRRWGR